jgi:hypothetical protein
MHSDQKRTILLRNSICIILTLILIFLYYWLSTWGMFLGYIGLTIIVAGLVIWKIKSIKYLYFSWLFLFLSSIVLFQNALNTYNSKTNEYIEKIANSETLNFNEKLSIYGLNIFMCIAAYPIYPEVSKESFYMMFRSKNGIRNFESDFFLKSKKIKWGLTNKNSYITWYSSEYALGHPESRYALALNPCKLSTKKHDSYTEYTVEVKIGYPKKSCVTLINFPFKLMVEEGLFHYLQNQNWLHTYTAVWKTRI